MKISPSTSSNPTKYFLRGELGLLLFFLCAYTQAEKKTSHAFDFEYRLDFDSIPKTGDTISLWIPYPIEDKYQQVSRWTTRAARFQLSPMDTNTGNRYLHTRFPAKSLPHSLAITFKIARLADTGFTRQDIKKKPHLDPAKYNGPDKLIPEYPQITLMAKEATLDSKNPLRALYDYTVDLMTYDKSGTGWGQGDAIWACNMKRGNCTDFHSLLIGMARSRGISGRFEIGFALPMDEPVAEFRGYHCWARLYDEVQGWIPVDASEAKKIEVSMSGTREIFYHRLPPNRIHFTSGRDLVLIPPQKGEPLNYFIYPYAEQDGKPIRGLKYSFKYTRR